MSQKKTLHTKKKPVDPENESELDVAEIGDPKSKKPIDLEAALEPAAIIDEKVEDEVLPVGEETEDGATDELTLDDEELNPFGDKWEQ